MRCREFAQDIQALIVDDPATSTLHGPFERFSASIPATQQADIRERGTALIAQKVIPAYRELLKFFDTDYMPHCRKAAGVGELEGGSDFYAWRVRYFTTTDMTPAEIHELGKSELVRIRQRNGLDYRGERV